MSTAIPTILRTPNPCVAKASPGNDFAIQHQRLGTQWKAVERTPGVVVISAPKLTLYPGYGDKPDIAVMVSKFYDPDGYIVELNEIIEE